MTGEEQFDKINVEPYWEEMKLRVNRIVNAMNTEGFAANKEVSFTIYDVPHKAVIIYGAQDFELTCGEIPGEDPPYLYKWILPRNWVRSDEPWPVDPSKTDPSNVMPRP
jgi:hypothetical protein